jgi:hypothetical protein
VYVCDLETTTMKKPGPNRAVELWKKLATFTSSDTKFFKNGVKQEDVYSPQFFFFISNFILGFRLIYGMSY